MNEVNCTILFWQSFKQIKQEKNKLYFTIATQKVFRFSIARRCECLFNKTLYVYLFHTNENFNKQTGTLYICVSYRRP